MRRARVGSDAGRIRTQLTLSVSFLALTASAPVAHSARNAKTQPLRKPLSWLAAGAPGRMSAVRRPEMHHSSLCAGAYLKCRRCANGWRKAMCGDREESLRGEKERKQWSIPTLSGGHPKCSECRTWRRLAPGVGRCVGVELLSRHSPHMAGWHLQYPPACGTR